MTGALSTVALVAGLAPRIIRVGAGVAVDRVTRRKPVLASAIPGGVDLITPDWLTAILCAGHPGAQVLGVRLAGGDAGSSTRQALDLHLNDAAIAAGVPVRLFSKSAPNFVQRMFLGLSKAAEGEAHFYSSVRPLVDLEAPRGYFAAIEPGSWRTLTLMEDISVTRGARFISTETYIDKPMMADLLATLARLHGRFWDWPSLSRDFGWARTTSHFLSDMSRFISFRDRAMLAMEKYPHLLPTDLHGKGEALYAATVASYEIDLRQPPTLLHGDAHIGQAYITGAGRMGYSDWQLVQRGSWAADFAYALTSALTIEDRRRWERELLTGYIEALAGAGGPHLSFDTAWLSYRQHTLYPFFAWAFTRQGAGGFMPDMQRDYVCNDIMSRTAAAVSDLEAEQAVTSALSL